MKPTKIITIDLNDMVHVHIKDGKDYITEFAFCISSIDSNNKVRLMLENSQDKLAE